MLTEDRVVPLQKVLLVGIQEIAPIADAPAVFDGGEDMPSTGLWERLYWRLFFLILGEGSTLLGEGDQRRSPLVPGVWCCARGLLLVTGTLSP